MTWKETYAPRIAERIREIMAEQPDITMKRLRWLLGQENPGPYGHMKKVWGAECTRQVNALTPEGRAQNRAKKRRGPNNETSQPELF